MNSKDVDSLLKIRPRYQLAMAMKNRQNTIATDFTYTLRNGKTGRLLDIKSEYTLLYFNNPDCPDCKRVKEILSVEAVFAQNPKLEILSIYPDKDLSLWNETIYPEAWIDARCREITEKGIYDLRAIPTLYLLDSNKRVVLKDAPVEAVGQYLATH